MRAADRALIDWLIDIEISVAKIVSHTDQLSFEEFVNREPVGDLVVLKLINMGEAARYIVNDHPTFAASAPIPLGELRMTRNRLAHGYFSIQYEFVWQVARENVPALLAQVRALIEMRTRR